MTILLSKQQLATPEFVTAKGYSLALFSDKARYKETSNEDSALITEILDGILIAVADGVGGSQHSHIASSMILSDIAKFVENHVMRGDELHKLLPVIQQTNEKLLKHECLPQTTLTLAVLAKNTIRYMQIGDSGLLLCGQRGKLKHRSIAQSPVGYALESGLVNEQEAIDHPDNNIVNNIIGDQLMRIEIGPALDFHGYDTLLLASDGIWDNLLSEHIIDTIRIKSIAKVSQKLATAILERKNPLTDEPFVKDDDITFILCRRDL